MKGPDQSQSGSPRHEECGEADRAGRGQVQDVDAIAAHLPQQRVQPRHVHLHASIERHADAERRERQIVPAIDGYVRLGVDAGSNALGRVADRSAQARGHTVDVAEMVVREDGDVHETTSPSAVAALRGATGRRPQRWCATRAAAAWEARVSCVQNMKYEHAGRVSRSLQQAKRGTTKTCRRLGTSDVRGGTGTEEVNTWKLLERHEGRVAPPQRRSKTASRKLRVARERFPALMRRCHGRMRAV